MIKIDSSFRLREPKPHYLGVGFKSRAFGGADMKTVLLAGLQISLEFTGRTYSVSAIGNSGPDGFRSRGFGWTRNVVRLGCGIAFEQQMLLANGGNTVALSWCLSGDALVPVELTATPIFSADEPTSAEPFQFDAETNGGRLSWQPYHRARKIIADTNGRCLPTLPVELARALGAAQNLATPATFAFALGRRPAALIFSVEPEANTLADPLLGAFLAELAQPTPRSEPDYLRSLAAA